MKTNQQYQTKLQSLANEIDKTQKELDEAEEALMQILGKSDYNYDVAGEKERYAKIFDEYLEHLKAVAGGASDPYIDTENYINKKNNQIANLSAKKESLKAEIENLESEINSKHQELIKDSQSYYSKVQDIHQKLEAIIPDIQSLLKPLTEQLGNYLKQLKNESDSIHPYYLNLLNEHIAKHINWKQQQINNLSQAMEELREKHNFTIDHQHELNQSLFEAEDLYNETNNFLREMTKARADLEELSKSIENESDGDRYKVTVSLIVEMEPIVKRIEKSVSKFSIISKTLEKASIRIVVKADDNLGRYGIKIPSTVRNFLTMRSSIMEKVDPREFSLLTLSESELVDIYNSLKE